MKLKFKAPDEAFTTQDFSPDGGGIDYLGLRWVNLSILSNHLLPGINNVTRDFGTYCLGAWIPWKFTELCKLNRESFKNEPYIAYREAIEVAIAMVMRSESEAEKIFGRTRTQIGVTKKIALPSTLSFEKAKRGSVNTLYSAPLYGPSLKHLGLLPDRASTEKGLTLAIPVISDDEETEILLTELDNSLRNSKAYSWLDKINPEQATEEIIDDLGLNGLHPAFARNFPEKVKKAFSAKLLPSDSTHAGFRRTTTAKLILSTITAVEKIETAELRDIWFTGMDRNGSHLKFSDPEVELQRNRWSSLQARQIQQYAIESVQRLFELELANGGRSLDKIVDRWMKVWDQKKAPANFSEVIEGELNVIGVKGDYTPTASQKWNEVAHHGHNSYDFIGVNYKEPEKETIEICCKRLARWWLRMGSRLQDDSIRELVELGGADRVSIKWFWQWIDQRRELSLDQFLVEFLSRIVFSQHVRVALGRFDGQVQRLRFLLGDEGIMPAASAKHMMGDRLPNWMADRLQAFIDLMTDLDLVAVEADLTLKAGKNAEWLN